MGESWIVSNLNAALSTWNDKLAEIWSLLTESPQTFKGGQVWGVMTGIHRQSDMGCSCCFLLWAL